MLPRSLWSSRGSRGGGGGGQEFVTNRITNLCLIVVHSSCPCHLSRSYYGVHEDVVVWWLSFRNLLFILLVVLSKTLARMVRGTLLATLEADNVGIVWVL